MCWKLLMVVMVVGVIMVQICPLTSAEDDQASRKKRESQVQADTGEEGRDESAALLMEVCEGNVKLDYGESVIIFSDNHGLKKKCKMIIESPAGTYLALDCPQFNLYDVCKKDNLKIKGLEGESKAVKFCSEEDPFDKVSETNFLQLKYNRKVETEDGCSGGFMCVVSVEGDSTTPTTTQGPSTCPETSPVIRPACDSCGQFDLSVPDYRIVGGVDADDGEHKYVVNLKGVCGGSIITKDYVLTAAHCLPGNPEPSSVYLRMGDYQYTVLDEGEEERNAKSIILHENYNAFTFENDIALIELDSPVSFNDRIQPICLGLDLDIPFGGKAVAVGWGDRMFGAGDYPEILQEVALDVITDQECQTKGGADPELFICGLTDDKDSCQGDSGGPLVARSCDGRWVQLGIVSHGEGCALKDSPGVYTRVPAYIDWILDKIGNAEC